VFSHSFLLNAALAGLFAGISCGIAGVFLVTTHLSFLGVCIAHAGFAGAILGIWLKIDPVISASVFSIAAAFAIGPLADKGELSPDTAAGIIFSLTIGLAFLFLGLMPGSRGEALSLFWGGILTANSKDLLLLSFVTLGTLVIVALFYKEIVAVLCHRSIAVAVGIPAVFVLYLLFVWSAIIIAVSLRIVGGLLIYSLVVNPAAAAFQLTYRIKYLFILSALFGVLSTWVGLFVSYFLDLPAGASIVIVSTVIFAVALFISPKRKTISDLDPVREILPPHNGDSKELK